MPRFIDLTPVVELAVRNPFSGKVYPEENLVLAVVDTGYEGFLLIPSDVFDETFGELESEKRELILADGRRIESKGVYGEVLLGRQVAEGFIETVRGVDEFVVGVEFLRFFKLELDYCVKAVRLKPCPKFPW